MRITIVTGFFLPVPPVRGGSTEKIWHRLAREFAAAGHQVTFISRRWEGMPECETVDGVSHVRVKGADHRSSLAANLWLDACWGLRVARVLPPADVVICNTVTLPAWLRRVRPSAGRVAAVVARMPKGHARFYGNVDLLLSLSEAVTAALIRENPKLAGRIAPFPFPIDWTLHAQAARTRIADPDTCRTIGYIGRIHPEKGLSLLLRAAAGLTSEALPPWRLEISGPSRVAQGGGGETFQGDLDRDFRPRLGDRLVFRDAEFNPAKLAERYAATDIFCYPSIAEKGETFGVAVAEAMAARCVPVVSALACFRDLVEHGQTGVVFDHRAANAPDQLRDQLRQLLTDSPACEQIRVRAQQHARRFDYADVAQDVLGRLSQLVNT